MARYLGASGLAVLLSTCSLAHSDSDCAGQTQKIILNPLKSTTKSQTGYVLPDNTFIIWAGSSINLDGLRTAYHRDDQKGGGVDLLCNAGRAYPADGPSYEGSTKGSCPRFMSDYARIRQAGWKNPQIGAINWYGFMAEGEVTIQGHKVENVVPVEQLDGGGFYVSTTSLSDAKNHPDPRDQARYLDAETIPFGVIPGNSPELKKLGISKGSFGVAIYPPKNKASPFVVGDSGGRVGEASYALSRDISGLPPQRATANNSNLGHLKSNVLWLFFTNSKGTAKPPYSGESVRLAAVEAFKAWGGEERLTKCVRNPAVPR